MITIISPIHKKQFLKNCIENFEKQTYKDKELLLIFNGELYDYKLNQYHILRTKSSNIAEIRNLGLNWMQQHNRKIFSYFDADDYYGEGYLFEAMEKLTQGYELVGKMDYQFTDGNDVYLTVGLPQDSKKTQIHGPTMTGYLSDKRFDLNFDSLAEDFDFIMHHDKVGLTGPVNFIYNVRSDSIQKRSFKAHLEQIKVFNSHMKNVKCKIYKNGSLYWEYGDPFNAFLMFENVIEE